MLRMTASTSASGGKPAEIPERRNLAVDVLREPTQQ
jgi:hypothetical protein